MRKVLSLITAGMLIAGFFASQAFAAAKLIKVDGSSTVFPVLSYLVSKPWV
jgi:ABC-type phosphate transport system substrate-binding protein